MKYKVILEEKEKITEEIVKQQNDSDLKVAKLEAEIKKVKSELILKSFRFVAEKKDDTIDECIVSVKCVGNCEHLSCRMQTMKLQGGRRTSPASNAEIRATHRCPQCDFSATTKSVLDSHVNNTNGMLPTCPFCNIGFQSLGALKRHIENSHKEKEVRQSVIIQNAPINPIVSQKLCIFYLQPRGCKKGQHCDFSHDSNSQQFEIVKVRKACYNGINC